MAIVHGPPSMPAAVEKNDAPALTAENAVESDLTPPTSIDTLLYMAAIFTPSIASVDISFLFFANQAASSCIFGIIIGMICATSGANADVNASCSWAPSIFRSDIFSFNSCICFGSSPTPFTFAACSAASS